MNASTGQLNSTPRHAADANGFRYSDVTAQTAKQTISIGLVLFQRMSAVQRSHAKHIVVIAQLKAINSFPIVGDFAK